MLSFRRWLDRKLDRRPVIRISRGSYRRRAWRRRWSLAIIAVLLILLTALCTPLLVSEPASTVRVVTISHASSGGLLLDGAPVSLAQLEQRLTALEAGTPDIAAVLDGPISPDGPVAALLGRLKVPWLSAADTSRSSPRSEHQGGDHGR